MEPIFEALLDRGLITEVSLLSFLVPSRYYLKLRNALNVRNSVFKQIGYNCPNLTHLDLSNCSQVSNSVVRAILQGCGKLEDMLLNNCSKVTDSAFHISESPFEQLVGYLSLESLSLQGCPQITGEIVPTLNKNCKQLKYLNLSQCKNVNSPAIQELFWHKQLRTLNLAFIDNVSDEAFCLLPFMQAGAKGSSSPSADATGKCSKSSSLESNIQKLNLGKSNITDVSMAKISNLSALLEINLQWCPFITDAGISTLAAHCLHLRIIDLKSCLITDESLDAIATQSKELKVLDLSWCVGLTNGGLHKLADSPVEELLLVWCSQITDDAIDSLRDIVSLRVLELSGSGISREGAVLLKNTGIARVDI